MRSVFNAEMPARIPKVLKQKRNELIGQRHGLIKAMQKIDHEIRTIDYAIKLIAPELEATPAALPDLQSTHISQGCHFEGMSRGHRSIKR